LTLRGIAVVKYRLIEFIIVHRPQSGYKKNNFNPRRRIFVVKTKFKGICAFALVLIMLISSIYHNAGTMNIYAEVVSYPTIQMGDNAPMTREEFLDWVEQKNIRFLDIEGRIMPTGAFFEWYNGNVFGYEKLEDRILYVYLIPNAVSDNRESSINDFHVTDVDEPPHTQMPDDTSPVIFYDLTPILFTDEELTAMIERVPFQNPMYTRSSITLPNRRLTESELEAWITEYNEMGGATAFELGVIREINRVREQYGLHPLALNPSLMMSARLKTQEFGDLQYYSHYSPVHGTVSSASRMFGFEGFAAETIARSGSNGVPVFNSTPERIVGGMLASSGRHRDILLNPIAYSVGFGSFFSPNSTGANGNLTHSFYFATIFEYVFD